VKFLHSKHHHQFWLPANFERDMRSLRISMNFQPFFCNTHFIFHVKFINLKNLYLWILLINFRHLFFVLFIWTAGIIQTIAQSRRASITSIHGNSHARTTLIFQDHSISLHTAQLCFGGLGKRVPHTPKWICRKFENYRTNIAFKLAIISLFLAPCHFYIHLKLHSGMHWR